MVNPRLSLLVCAHLAAATAMFAQSSYVFQLPGLAQTGQAPQIEGLGDNNFGRLLGPASNANYAGATKVVATTDGNKFYILTSSGIFAAGKTTLNNPTPLSAIAGNVTDAQITPDGKYLFVIASHLYIVNIAQDSLAADADTGIPPGATPIAVAVSHDSKTAWILSSSATGSTVTALDMASLQPASGSPLSLLSGASSMVLSPKGLLYVTTAANRLYEIDPVQMAVTPLGQIAIPGLAGPLQFTPDGNYAYFINGTACGSCSPIFKLTVQAHSISTWLPSDNSAPPTVDQMLVAGNNRVFALSSATRTLYDVTPSPFALSPAAIGVLPTGSVVAAAVSNEIPSSRFLYLMFSDLTFDRVNLAINGVDQLTTLDSAKGAILSFVPVPAQTGAANLSLINASQTLAPGATTVLTGQVLDSVGRPVMGAAATFSTDGTSGIAITNPVVTTTSGGWAQTTVTAPAVAGNYTVTLTSGSLSGTFSLSVNAPGSGGNTGGNTPKMSIYAGDGELLRQNQSTNGTDTHVPLTVKIVDENGNPLPDVTVAFGVETGGLGYVVARNQGLTDKDGLARADYATSSLANNFTVQLSKVLATSVYGSVEFYEVTHDALSTERQPDSQIITPAQSRTIEIPQGGFRPGAIAVSTNSEKSPGPIPNVGLRLVDDGNNPIVNSQIASCVGLSRGDNNGVSRCDLQLLPGACALGTGDHGIILEVGERVAFAMTLRITPGTASVLTRVTDQTQTGSPGNSFTLVAQVTDGCGEPLLADGLTWSIIQGAGLATLSHTQTSSDTGGSVSTQITLGQTAGVIQVQLSGPGLTPVVFSITNQISVSGISPVSGAGQSAVVGHSFAQPLVFSVHDANNHPVQGAFVTFSVSGSGAANASLTPGNATSDAQGRVQTTVTAGGTPGNIVVTAAVSGQTATETLSSHASGPTLTSTSFTNAASGTIGMTPCGFVTVTGSGVAPDVQGVVTPVTFFGAYPYSLSGLSITVNGIPVPIQAIANDQFGQRANFQAPCELTGSGATVVVTVSGASTIITGVPVFPVQPGIFTYTGANNKLYGAVIREVNGTYVTSANPALQGEKVYVVVTGLGQTTPALVTNSAGTGSQTVNVPMLIFLNGLNGQVVPALSARYMFGWVGAYLVEFQIPADSPIGPDRSLLVVALVNNNQDFVVGNTVLLPAVAPAPAP